MGLPLTYLLRSCSSNCSAILVDEAANVDEAPFEGART